MTLSRHDSNPLITREDVPDIPPHIVDATSVFNPGAVRHEGRVLLLLRVQTRGRETFLVPAVSDDGVEFEVIPRVAEIRGLERLGEEVHHVYDPRITPLPDGGYAVLVAIDTANGCRAGVVVTPDFEDYELVSVETGRDLRNAVLFPEKVGGRWVRLERPNRPVGGGNAPSGDEIWLAESDDLATWRPVERVLSGRPHYWDERIGSGPPPIRTPDGWLHLYHGIATHFGGGIYQAGAVLLDADDPTRVLARTRDNVLEPREMWEMVGQVPNVVFPSGLVAFDDGRILVYYGAADTVVGLAETTIGEMMNAF